MRPPRLRKRLLRIAALALVVYGSSIALLCFNETALLYQAHPGPAEPAEAGLKGFTRQSLVQQNAAAIVYWENTNAPADAPTILYFHGNGGGLYYHVPYIAYLAAQQFHVIAMEYPGYPGVEGTPSQALIVAQAIALFDHAAQQNHHRKPIIWGYSLGSGVATQLAAKRPPAALVLEAPFTAVVDRAAELFPLAPVHYLMRDQYRSREVIGSIHAPLFIVHGTHDMIIPIHHGRDLFALANEPKQFHSYPGYGHLNLIASPAYADATAFIRTQLRKSN